jgi:hypothetical protein
MRAEITIFGEVELIPLCLGCGNSLGLPLHLGIRSEAGSSPHSAAIMLSGSSAQDLVIDLT